MATGDELEGLGPPPGIHFLLFCVSSVPLSLPTVAQVCTSSTFSELTQPDAGFLLAAGAAVQTGQLQPKHEFALDCMVVSKEFKLAVDIYKPERLLTNSRFPAPQECSSSSSGWHMYVATIS